MDFRPIRAPAGSCLYFNRVWSIVCNPLVTMVPEVPGGLVALSGGPSLLLLVAIDFGGKPETEGNTTSSLTKFVCFVFWGILTCSLTVACHLFGLYKCYVVIPLISKKRLDRASIV